MTLQEQLFREVRKAVALSGKTQVAIARGAGVSRSHVATVLQGRKPLTIGMAEKIADECGFDLTISGHGRWA